jgi:hypothetical protein
VPDPKKFRQQAPFATLAIGRARTLGVGQSRRQASP